VDRSERLLTTSELAKALSLSVRTIQRYRSEGLLLPTSESPGGHARWDLEDAREQMRELARKAREKYQRED
jgi:DNA-binding transcriptional MerR regulator